ncbi:lipoyl(octanoyl) transferase LipB [Natroniella acetigena]|uniref:lipoyl(octanoyl) transferase LipB n=1 Tax=Natroniella acetigena TaxID=52004 RepID=UPI00200A0252|nr:lipoyl(octanoyl) transferase LipB [Natroniella acetigena]MCK8827064.1 lipoyl(octanoyl) transferase LipB [Natroniella acetigena]
MELNLIEEYNMSYQKAYQLQKELFALRKQDKINDTLFLTSHPHVITMGRSGSNNNLLINEETLDKLNIEVINIERGGDVTYHGPGQIVGYPILDLNNFKRDLHYYVRKIEQIIIALLADYDINAERIKGLPGVWVANEKIAAIGIAARKWVTMHGFALNVNPDLSYFDYIIPCGITDKRVTSMEKISNKDLILEEVAQKLLIKFKQEFEFTKLKKQEVINGSDNYDYSSKLVKG